MTEKMNKLSNIINVPTLDPEDARRRRLLNIMLLAVATGALLMLAALLIAAPMGLAGEQEEVRALGFGIALALFGVAVIYALNRYVSGELASTLFLLLMIAIAAFSDEPRQVVDGRGLLVFTIPILAASVLLRPWASLVTAGLSGLTIIAVGLGAPGHFPNVPAILSFFVLALVSWLSARSLERALQDSRVSSAALRESEEQYRQLIDTMQEGVWAIDQDAHITFVNPRMAEMLGCTAEDMLGKHWLSFMDEGEMEIAQRNLEHRQQGVKEQHDLEFVRKDGARIYALVATSPLTDADGNYIGAITGIQDITERKRAEERARRLLDQQIAVNQLALALGETRDINRIYDTIYQHIEAMVDAEAFIVAFYDSETELIRAGYVVSRGEVRDVTNFPPIPLEEAGKGTQSQVIHTGEPFYCPDWRKAMARTKTEYKIAENGTVSEGPPPPEQQEDSTNSALYVPMKVEGEVIGVMQVQSHRLDGYSQEDIDLLTGMANVAAVAVQNARLYGEVERELAERVRAEEELRKHREHLEDLVRERTAELRKIVNLMAGREVRMAELKGVIRKLRAQLKDAGLKPVADDPLFAGREE